MRSGEVSGSKYNNLYDFAKIVDRNTSIPYQPKCYQSSFQKRPKTFPNDIKLQIGAEKHHFTYSEVEPLR